MTNFYRRAAEHVNLLGDGTNGWRSPQVGALGATMAHWTLSEREPTLISIPTGRGKTAVAMVAPFLGAEPPRRVLVLAPARQIRQQLVGHFASYTQLQRLGVLPATIGAPSVFKMSGRLTDWSVLDSHDVVIALPNSISPVHYEENQRPPRSILEAEPPPGACRAWRTWATVSRGSMSFHLSARISPRRIPVARATAQGSFMGVPATAARIRVARAGSITAGSGRRGRGGWAPSAGLWVRSRHRTA
jgi:hypothetical protein